MSLDPRIKMEMERPYCRSPLGFLIWLDGGDNQPLLWDKSKLPKDLKPNRAKKKKDKQK